MSSRLASRVGPYLLDEVVGRGSSGVVWRAYDELSGDVVALKLLDDGQSDDPTTRTRFARECELVGAFSHPGLVRLRAAGATAEGLDYLVMDLALGPTLKDRLALDPPLGLAEGLALVVAAADALAAMHRAGWVHRDVKPANLVLDDEGRPRLLDFGLAARVGSSEGRLTAAGFFVGTPLYLAPEQLMGAPPAPTMDVYALGATLFEVLTGTPPFTGATESLLAAKATREAPDYEGPEPIRKLLRASLARNPADRPADAAAFAAEVRALLATLEPTADLVVPAPEAEVERPEEVASRDRVTPRPSPAGSSGALSGGEPPRSADPLVAGPEAPPPSDREILEGLITRVLEAYAPARPARSASPRRGWVPAVIATLVAVASTWAVLQVADRAVWPGL